MPWFVLALVVIAAASLNVILLTSAVAAVNTMRRTMRAVRPRASPAG